MLRNSNEQKTIWMNIADRDFLWPTLSPRTVKEKTRLLYWWGPYETNSYKFHCQWDKDISKLMRVLAGGWHPFFFFRQVSLDSGERRSPRCVMGKQVVILQRGKWSFREQKFGWNSFWFWCFGVRVFVCFSTDDKKPWSRNKSYFFTFQEVLLCMIHARLGERLGTEACGTRECWTEIRFLWLM